MRLWTGLQLLTFVVLFGIHVPVAAAPSTKVPPSDYNKETTSKETLPQKEPELDSRTTAITPEPGPVDRQVLDRIRLTRITRDEYAALGLGAMSGPVVPKEPSETAQILSLNYGVSGHDEQAFEGGLDLTTKSRFGFHWQYKKFCCLGSYAEPYWTLGGAALYPTSNLLAQVADPNSYQLQAGIGLDDVGGLNRRWKLELLVGQGLLGTSIFGRLGYVFDDRFNQWLGRALNF